MRAGTCGSGRQHSVKGAPRPCNELCRTDSRPLESFGQALHAPSCLVQARIWILAVLSLGRMDAFRPERRGMPEYWPRALEAAGPTPKLRRRRNLNPTTRNEPPVCLAIERQTAVE